MRSSLTHRVARQTAGRNKGFRATSSWAKPWAQAIKLKRPVAYSFPQYAKFFLALKRNLKLGLKERLRISLATLRLKSFFQHAEKSRMGKGASRLSGFLWRGRPGDFVLYCNRQCLGQIGVSIVPQAYGYLFGLIFINWIRKNSANFNC